jgi:ubiquinone/menaquinone biosynthesis C-methylase UbiE
MTSSDTVFAGSIPALYDRYMGPMIFAPYAEDTARRLAGLREGRLLETAAGTGIVTRALARTLPAAVAITATDLNQAMIDHAAAQDGVARVAWRHADALKLPFDDGAFDAVVCQFGAMFFPDRIAAYAEARRVLTPDGTFVVSLWDRIEENEFAAVVTDAVAALFPADPPQFLSRTPHGHHDTERVGDELAAAGFGRVEVASIERRSRASSPRDPAVGYCQGTPLRNEIEARAADRLAEVTDIAAAALAARFGGGAVDGKIRAHIFTARR